MDITKTQAQFPKVGDRYEWGGRERVVSKYYPPTKWVYFEDGSSCRFSKQMRPIKTESETGQKESTPRPIISVNIRDGDGGGAGTKIEQEDNAVLEIQTEGGDWQEIPLKLIVRAVNSHEQLLDLVRRAMLNLHNDSILLRRHAGSSRDEKETQWWKDAEAAISRAEGRQ